MRFWLSIIFAAFLLTGPTSPGFAVEPGEVLADKKLEKRARKISAELRCLVCQNQSIDDSNAPLAKDLRILVRERLQAGDTDSQVIDFIVARYGEFVLLRPRLSWNTIILWFSAPLLLIIACLVMYLAYRKRVSMKENDPESLDLTADEKKKLEEFLDKA